MDNSSFDLILSLYKILKYCISFIELVFFFFENESQFRTYMRTLNQLKKGESVRLVQVHQKINKSLIELGFTPGVLVRIHHISPFKGPISIEIRGSIIALRYDEAKLIEC